MSESPGGAVGILHVIGGADRGKAHPLARPETTIGRGADQDCVLADIAVSRQHVVITMEGSRYRLRDRGSGNGSLLNGVRTETALLVDGDQIEIGNTLLRFEHPPSRIDTQAPTNRPLVSDANAPTLHEGDMPGVAKPTMALGGDGAARGRPGPITAPPMEPRSDPPIVEAPRSRQAAAAPPSRVRLWQELIDTRLKRVVVFGLTTLVLLLGGAVVAKKRVQARGAETQRLYLAGAKAFREEDFDAAQRLFMKAARLAPEVASLERYIKQCEQEARAQGALKTAQGLKDAKRWEESLKALDGVDRESIFHERVEKVRRMVTESAVAAELNQARQELARDPETARAKVEAALALDPENPDAQALARALQALAGITRAASPSTPREAVREAPEPPRRGQAETRAEEERPAREKRRQAKEERAPKPAARARRERAVAETGDRTRAARAAAPPTDDEEDDDEGGPASSTPGTDVLAFKGAAEAYRTRDFHLAAQALRLEAGGKRGQLGQRAQALAARVANLGSIFARAEGEKGSPTGATLTAYQQALAIDGQIGRGTHAAYFKGQLVKLSRQLAQQSLGQQKWDIAYQAAKVVKQNGGDDSSIVAQLKTKAGELNQKAAAMQKANPNGAKTLWRMVVKMVPPGDPSYLKAYQSLNAASSKKDDDDE